MVQSSRNDFGDVSKVRPEPTRESLRQEPIGVEQTTHLPGIIEAGFVQRRTDLLEILRCVNARSGHGVYTRTMIEADH